MKQDTVTISGDTLLALVNTLQEFLGRFYLTFKPKVYGVPRGGQYVLALLTNATIAATPEEADCFVDDLIDSGKTREKFAKYKKPFFVLIDKTDTSSPYYGKWVVFPWELEEEAVGPEDNVRRVLQYLGEDPNREGLVETPKRFLKMMKELTQGYADSPEAHLAKRFHLDDQREGLSTYDQIILSGPLPFSSLCEHHLAPFEGQAWIGYLPGAHGSVVGLSKLARVLDLYAKRLQVQERLTVQIADAIERYLEPQGVGVLIRSRHLCQCHRGVKKEGRMVTSILRGNFRDVAVRAEFLSLVNLSL